MEPTCYPGGAPKKSTEKFAREKEGAQLIEYGLIITVVCTALVIALQISAGSGAFATFITRITACLTTPTCG